MNLRDRLKRLEDTARIDSIEPLGTRQLSQAGRWSEIVLERYCEGRLDGLAAQPELPIGKMLRGLAADGYAVEVDGHWHPLYIGCDARINAQVIDRLDQLAEERISVAIDARRAQA
jgi:hypothetical protein